MPTVADALAAVGERRYAVVMADHSLPDVPGLDLLAALRGAAGDTVLLLCSGVLTDELRTKAKDFGIMILEKPLCLDGLVSAVREALGSRSRAR